MSARVTLDKLLTHIVSLPRFDGRSSTYGALSNGIYHFFLNERYRTIILLGPQTLDFAMPYAGKVDERRTSTPLAKLCVYTPNPVGKFHF